MITKNMGLTTVNQLKLVKENVSMPYFLMFVKLELVGAVHATNYNH